MGKAGSFGLDIPPSLRLTSIIHTRTNYCKQELWKGDLFYGDIKVSTSIKAGAGVGAAGSLQSIWPVMLWLRRLDESHHFNSNISVASHLFKCVYLGEGAAESKGNECKHSCKHSTLCSCFYPPFIQIYSQFMADEGSVSARFTHKCKHENTYFCFDLKPEEKHELCDPGTESETFTAGGSVCRKPRGSTLERRLVFWDLYFHWKSHALGGAGEAVRGRGCWGCQSQFHLSSHTPAFPPCECLPQEGL